MMSDKVGQLAWYHFRTLEVAERSILSDMNYDTNIPELVEAGYLIGRWYGSLDYAPGKMWEISTEGRKALKQYKLNQLIARTTQCPEGTCKGEYGTEVYVRTDCKTCGRPIIRGGKQ